ncbi:MAG: DNA-binding protein, partial [Halioglobus sp.]|nr:DNA-binding protein [Halioglobus sp.]
MTAQVPIAAGLFTWPAANPALLGSRCDACGVVAFPAASACMACSGQSVTIQELPRQGSLWTWTIQRFMPKTPYNSGETAETFKPYG